MIREKNEVVVVGAGPGGLASAILLASRGAKVRVLERRSVVGGRTSELRMGDYRFDLGPTFFLYPRILEEIFESVGERLGDWVELVRLDPQYRILFGDGGHIDATPDIDRMMSEIASVAPQDAAGFPQFLENNRAKLAKLEPVLESSFNGWRDLLKQSLIRSVPFVNPHLSVDGYLRRFFKDPRIRLAFSFQSKYLGMSPFQCPSLFSILSFLEYEHGVFHPIGGCSAVTRAMEKVARKLGVEFCLGEQVEETVFDGKRMTAVRTGDGLYEADAFVVNADFAHFMRRSVEDKRRRRWRDEKLAKKRYSCSTFMLYLGMDRTFDLPHHNILISEDYETNLRQIEEEKIVPTNPSVYVQNACVTDPTLAPSGKSGLYVLAPAPHESPNVDWTRETSRFRAKVLDRVRQIGFDIDEKAIQCERVITPDDWRDQYYIHKGATFNLAHNLGQLLHLRPRNRFEDIEGVYLVGGGTHPGSGLPVIFESARISSSLLEADLGLAGAPQAPTYVSSETSSPKPAMA